MKQDGITADGFMTGSTFLQQKNEPIIVCSLILTVNENLSQELKILFKGLNFCGDSTKK